MSADKENNIKRSNHLRSSLGGSKQVLINSELTNSTELTNEFAGYLDYVRTLQSENDILKSEKINLISSCQKDIDNVKLTYGNEIDALRKALDETTNEKCTIEYHNEKLLEENNNLKIKFARKIDAINDLEQKYEEAEAALIKNRKCIEQYEIVCQENDELVRCISLTREHLKNEVSRRTEAESRLLTLSDELEFQKKLNANNNNAIRDNSLSTNSKPDAIYSERFDIEMKAMRDELTEEFDQYKEKMEAAFADKLEELSAMNSKLNDKCTKLYNDKKSLQSVNDTLSAEMVVLESKISSISAREVRQSEIIAKINKDHDDFIKDILEDNDHLKEKVQEMTAEIGQLLNEKIANEKETYIFRSMLKGEQSRFNLSDVTSPKKRKLDMDICDENEIIAWSKDTMRIFCDASYNGNYVILKNEGSDEVNLNEWKIEMTTDATHVLYTFPEMIIGAGSSINVWGIGQDVLEDETNVIMNIELPVADVIVCKLRNDMDENEARFELKRSDNKRKILKASIKKSTMPECSMM